MKNMPKMKMTAARSEQVVRLSRRTDRHVRITLRRLDDSLLVLAEALRGRLGHGTRLRLADRSSGRRVEVRRMSASETPPSAGATGATRARRATQSSTLGTERIRYCGSGCRPNRGSRGSCRALHSEMRKTLLRVKNMISDSKVVRFHGTFSFMRSVQAAMHERISPLRHVGRDCQKRRSRPQISTSWAATS